MTSEGMNMLEERVSQADAIVSGIVIGTESIDRPDTGPISHHEPLWVAVKIRIDSVLKGEVVGDTVVAEIPRSADPRVDAGVRPEVGQSGIWILHRAPDGRLTMGHSFDYQTLEATHRVTGLLVDGESP